MCRGLHVTMVDDVSVGRFLGGLPTAPITGRILQLLVDACPSIGLSLFELNKLSHQLNVVELLSMIVQLVLRAHGGFVDEIFRLRDNVT